MPLHPYSWLACLGVVDLSLWMLTRLSQGDLASVRYKAWTARHRLDFSPVSLDGLGLPVGTAEPYVNSGGPDLDSLLEQLRIPPDSRIVDLGCGKGGACFTLAPHFREVLGIDISAPLIEAARQNAARIGLSRVNFTAMDATQFLDWDRFSYAYAFNPFPTAVMSLVVNRIAESLERHPRRFTFLYLNPRADVDRVVFPYLTELPHPKHRCCVYQH